MHLFFKIAAYVFHPLWIPTIGTALYYWLTPRHFLMEVMQTKLLVVFILTFLIPLLTFFILKNLYLVNSLELATIKERKIPLMIQCALFLLIVKFVFNPYTSSQLYFFFLAILFSALTAFILILMNFKVSLHMIGIAGLTMFIIALSIHFSTNALALIASLFFINGWVASSRMYTGSHTYSEIIAGFFVGLVPQLIVANYWL